MSQLITIRTPIQKDVEQLNEIQPALVNNMETARAPRNHG